MNQRFFSSSALVAGILAVGIAGCNNGGDTTGSTSGGSTTSGGSGGGETLATVGGSQVTRTDMNRILEAQGGKQVLPYLIDTQLLLEEAKTKNIAVSDDEVTAELTRRGQSDPQIKEVLAKGGPLADLARSQIRRDLVVGRIISADVKPTDQQVTAFFNKYRAYYDQPRKVKIGVLVTATQARADALSRALKAKSKTFDALVAEQKQKGAVTSAGKPPSDPYAGQSTSAITPDFVTLDSQKDIFGPKVVATLEKLPKGAASNVQTLGQAPRPIFAIFQITDEQPQKKADLAKMRETVETDYKMSEVAKQEVKRNPQNPPFDTTLSRTRDALRNGDPMSRIPAIPSATMRDVLSTILRPASENLLSTLRTKGTVQISDPTYADLGKAYQAAPTANGTAMPGGATGNATTGNATTGGATGNATTGGAASNATTPQ